MRSVSPPFCSARKVAVRRVPVHVDGLQQAYGHPGPQEEDVVAEDHDADEEARPQDDGLSGVGILGLHAKRRLVDK